MENRKIELSIDTATRWYNGADAELKELAVQTFPELAKKQLPKTWEELGEIKGYYVSNNSNIFSGNSDTDADNKNVFATKEQAEASIAFAQLTQLREVYRHGWVPNWADRKDKYCIYYFRCEIRRETLCDSNTFLSFQDHKTRDLFLDNFRGLIEKASPLLF